ncbi:oxalate:formate antiporter [Ectobacillus sp. JY-23]|uniref:oxalate:formate antiporter n=1 Tax=Ectobacillus sp. JY-23 TaxID=2933872 RepID=UPI001FF55C48|nr:oxalate:formate antiporter [Ectobacillus sp. JY-23]UOY92782.1 oxalate:formate antiporter [Ectobacillus sp. JY-23]
MSGGSDQINAIYINGDRRNQCFLTSGISFHEFANNIPSPLRNVLLLKHDFEWTDYNYHTLFEYVEEENIQRLISADVKQFREFCWIDFDDVNDLEEMEPIEIAELLYLAHKKEPMGKPFFALLKNKYVYLSPDDGWLNKVYFRRLQDFAGLLSKVIPYKLGAFGKKRFSLFQKTKIYPAITRAVMEQMLPWTEDGLLIDLENKQETRRGLEIPLYVVGSYTNADDVMENLEELRAQAQDRAWLIFDKKEQEWKWETE